MISSIPERKYLFKVSYSSTRTRCENCSGLRLKTMASSGVFMFNCENISTCLIVDFEQANVFRVYLEKIALLKTRSGTMRYFVLY